MQSCTEVTDHSTTKRSVARRIAFVSPAKVSASNCNTRAFEFLKLAFTPSIERAI
jgi:hypothetical protein